MRLPQLAIGTPATTLIPGLLAAALSFNWLHERAVRRAAERFAAAALEALLFAIDANDPATGRHVRRVAAYSLILAERAGLDQGARREVERAALFHDIGKISEALFDIVHDRKGLTEKDRLAVVSHPRRGAEVLAPLTPFYPGLAEAVLSHHERWDGSGYPRGLAGTEIPLTARIVAVADTFDAITAARRYSSPRSSQAALQLLRHGRGTQFEPRIVNLFVEPWVQVRVRRAARELRRSGRPGRRAASPEPLTPDVSFRWREPRIAPPAYQSTPATAAVVP